MSPGRTALDVSSAHQRDAMARRRSVDLIVHTLRDFIPEACFRIAIDRLHDAFERGGIELTNAAMRKEYEAWKSLTIELPKPPTKCECGKPDIVSCYNPDCARPA